MKTWLLILFPLYLALIAFLALRSRQKNTSTEAFFLGGTRLGLMIGLLTVAATLFSTFTMMGMPDFFRLHGVGAWVFLAVSDAALVFCIVWFGFHLRKKAAEKGFQGMGGMLTNMYENRAAGILYFIGIFIFLIPYVAIQIQGIFIFLNHVFPDTLSNWGWAFLIIATMLLYSETGGLKAIIFADVMQAVLLMLVVWAIAINSVQYFGGIGEMFAQVKETNEALLSTPGPKGLFNLSFLVGSFLAIFMLPISQPQVSTRLVIMKDIRETHRMAIALGVFAILVILPTVVIGLYGSVRYGDVAKEVFFVQALLEDPPAFIGAAAIIGLVAAAISTSDSQIFALGNELRSILSMDEKKAALIGRIAIAGFALATMVFSVLSTGELALLAIKSIAGTALMAPMILAAILSNKKPPMAIVWITALGVSCMVLSVFGVLPKAVMGMQMELALLLILVGINGTIYLVEKNRS